MLRLTLLEVSRHICRPRVKGIPTYMSPRVKGYTDIYIILTYTGTETDVSFGLFIPEIHFFGQGLKFYSPLKGLSTAFAVTECIAVLFAYCVELEMATDMAVIAMEYEQETVPTLSNGAISNDLE